MTFNFKSAQQRLRKKMERGASPATITPSPLQSLKAAIKADPNPKRTTHRKIKLTAEIRRNRVRLGLPEYPTEMES